MAAASLTTFSVNLSLHRCRCFALRPLSHRHIRLSTASSSLTLRDSTAASSPPPRNLLFYRCSARSAHSIPAYVAHSIPRRRFIRQATAAALAVDPQQEYNICKNIHLPAQTGSTTVLERMRRGYTREAYLELVDKIRKIIPDVGLTGDFICGFCGETEEEHADTLSLMKAVGYDMAFMFAYSMRERTHAHRNYLDDVPDGIKQKRLTELIDAFRESTGQCYDSQVGTIQLVLVEGPNKRAPESELIGKSDRGHRVSFPKVPLSHSFEADGQRNPEVGDYVEVHIRRSTKASLFGEPLKRTSLSRFHQTSMVSRT